MFTELLLKEIRTALQGPKLLITWVVAGLLIFAALLTGAVTYEGLVAESLQQEAAERDRLENVFNFPMDLMRQGVDLHRRPDVLGMLVTGVEGDAARRAEVDHYTMPSFDVSTFNTTPILAVFGILDLGFIVKIVLSLFAILFTFDAVSGEKRDRTLGQIFSNSVRRMDFIFAKVAGATALVILPFLLPLGIGLLLLQFFPNILFSAEDWMRAGLIVLTFVLFLFMWVCLGIMVSSMTRRTSVSFLVLLMLWVLFNGIVPRVSVWLAQNIQPVPPLDEVTKQFYVEYGEAQEEFADAMSEEMQAFARAAEENPMSMLQPEQEMMDSLLEEHNAFALRMQLLGQQISREQDLKQKQQNAVAIAIARVTSPAAAMTFATHRLARTGVFSSDEYFRRTAEEYKKRFDTYVRQQIEADPVIVTGGNALKGLQRDDSAVYPDSSTFARESFEMSFLNAMTDMLIIAMYTVLALGGSLVFFSRYDLR